MASVFVSQKLSMSTKFISSRCVLKAVASRVSVGSVHSVTGMVGEVRDPRLETPSGVSSGQGSSGGESLAVILSCNAAACWCCRSGD